MLQACRTRFEEAEMGYRNRCGACRYHAMWALLLVAWPPAWAADLTKETVVHGVPGAVGEDGGSATAQQSFADVAGQSLSVSARAYGGPGGNSGMGDGAPGGYGGSARATAIGSGLDRTDVSAQAFGGAGGAGSAADGGNGGGAQARARLDGTGAAGGSAQASAVGGHGGASSGMDFRAGAGGMATADVTGYATGSDLALATAVGGDGGASENFAYGGDGGAASATLSLGSDSPTRPLVAVVRAIGGAGGGTSWGYSGGGGGDATAHASVNGRGPVQAEVRAEGGIPAAYASGFSRGGRATASGHAGTTGAEARSFVTAIGSDGQLAYGSGGDGATASGDATAASGSGDAWASLLLQGGKGGDSQAGDGGRGADVFTSRTVGGSARGTLHLSARVQAGSGGDTDSTQGGNGGAGGQADAALRWSGSGASAVSGALEVRGGAGGSVRRPHGPPEDGAVYGEDGFGGAARGVLELAVDSPGSAADAVLGVFGGRGGDLGGRGGSSSGTATARAGRVALARSEVGSLDWADATAQAQANASERRGAATATAIADSLWRRADAQAQAQAGMDGRADVRAQTTGDGDSRASAQAEAAGTLERVTSAKAVVTGRSFGLATARVAHGEGVGGPPLEDPFSVNQAFTRIDAAPADTTVASALSRAPAVAAALASGTLGVIAATATGVHLSGYLDDESGHSAEGGAHYRISLAGSQPVVLGLVDFTGQDGGLPIDFRFSVENFGQTLLSRSFTSLSAAESFFKDRTLDLGVFSGVVDLTVDYTFSGVGAQDFGLEYLVAAGALMVPEPATWALWLAGIGLATTAARWRRERGSPRGTTTP
ncbi:hypothetical protein CKO43_06690 [Rubrivivax gelatinosus]|uniref:Ice-binding protein C-terminal domain-containing protein n=2 Tax=Rubrivivax gelatinosus TaxID=28068 RepID=A0ABS1DRZ2_RUBGE|nr:hypothetical protein [Rubrivivax gelatinosus]